MHELAQRISTEFLPRVERPGQYIGHETNARCGNFHDAELRCVLAFPDAYTIGISHLGSSVLYALLNDLHGVICDRSYCPPPDAETVLREANLPLFGWETRAPLGAFDLLGFSLGYELCVTNVLTMLDLASVPLHAADRTAEHPIVVGGDALADSPEPIAPFFDILIPGDGEGPLAAVAEKLRAAKAAGPIDREAVLLDIARTVDHCYVPRFYEPRHDAAGRLVAIEPTREGVPATIDRACLPRLDDSPALTAPLVPLAEAVHDRVVIEVMRGCPNACRFCQAGAVRKPVRRRSVDEIVRIAREAIDNTGCREIGLLSLSTSDYPELDELVDRLTAEFTPRHVGLSLPSLRVDSQLTQLPKLTSEVRKAGLTIAAEAGSPRLREAIRKGITETDMIAGVKAAFEAGFRSIKVYFMAGLPGETDDDLDAMVALCKRLAATRRDIDGHYGAINASVSWFVPKPHTPMQWAPMRDAEYFFHVRHRLRDAARKSTVNFRFHWIERSLLEALIARGDRRVAEVIEAAWRRGARMDSWDEHFDYQRWLDALEDTGVDLADIVHRAFDPEEFLPWSHIRCRTGGTFLQAEYDRMQATLARAPEEFSADES